MTTSRVNTSPLFRALFSARDTDGRLQHVLEQLPAAAFFVVPRTGALLAINGRAAALTEWARDELLARSLSEVVAAPAAAAALEQIHQLEPGQSRSLNAVPLRTRSGRSALVDLRLSAAHESISGEVQVLILATPAEERLALERDQAQQVRALECLDQLMALFASPAESHLAEAVQLIQDMLGAEAAAYYRVSPDQPGMQLRASTPGSGTGTAGRSFPPALGPSEAQYLKTPLRWTATQHPEGYLHQSARAAGWGTLLAHPVGEPPAIVGAVCIAYRPGNSPPAHSARLLALAAQHLNQLTALLGREASHQRSRALAVRFNEQLAAINAQIDEGVVLLNRRGTLDEINSAAARMLGYRSEEVTGLGFADVLMSEGTLTALIERTLEQADSGFAQECRLLRRSGEDFPAIVRAQPLPQGGAVLTLRDLSDVQANAVQQEHLDQLAYVGQATQSFAHEVRGPLNNIAMGVQYVASRLTSDEALSQALSKIQGECSRLSALMNDMLAWAKPVNPNFQPTDLDPVLRRLLNRFNLKIEQRNVRLNYTVDPDCPQVLADARLLEQVFVNLIDNALQAMPAGGQLGISLGCSSRGTPGTMVVARVADSGPGISDEARRRIFDPYFTTKPDGTGLGLAICKRLVTIHRGAIGVESYPGTGTLFTVTLPAYTAPASLTE